LQLYFKPINNTATKLSTHNDEKKNHDLNEFLELGQDCEVDGYELIDEIEVDYDEEERLQLASTGVAFPNAKSSQDGEDYIVRYKYTGSSVGERPFCNKMLSRPLKDKTNFPALLEPTSFDLIFLSNSSFSSLLNEFPSGILIM